MFNMSTGYIFRQVKITQPLKGVLADYDIFDALGEGAGGRVIRVAKRSTSKWYAAKRITPSKIRPRGGRSGFDVARREITIMKALKHPNICRIYDYYISKEDDTLGKQKTAYRNRCVDCVITDIIMEIVDGGNLSRYVLETENGLSE